MKITWTKTAWEDYLFWQKQDKKKLKRINELIKNTLREPFSGIGNPEALKHDLQGYWSRRIDGEHRLVYSFSNETLLIIACRYHY
jgi:toxin YoeB